MKHCTLNTLSSKNTNLLVKKSPKLLAVWGDRIWIKLMEPGDGKKYVKLLIFPHIKRLMDEKGTYSCSLSFLKHPISHWCCKLNMDAKFQNVPSILIKCGHNIKYLMMFNPFDKFTTLSICYFWVFNKLAHLNQCFLFNPVHIKITSLYGWQFAAEAKPKLNYFGKT